MGDANRKRNNGIMFRLTDKEKAKFLRKMKSLGIENQNDFLIKIINDKEIINEKDYKTLITKLDKIEKEVNRITNKIKGYKKDEFIDKIEKDVAEISELINKIFSIIS